jgi:hypothetical protein
MNRNAGIAVMLAVAFAALRFSSDPSPESSKSEPKTQVTKPAVISKPGRATMGKPHSCTAYELEEGKKRESSNDADQGAATAVIDRFFGISNPTKLQDKRHVRYAIALAPDPLHTELSMMFDREMEVIQQAAQDEGFTYNSSWLPWRQETQTYPRLEDQQRFSGLTDQRETCPGVLLFRRSANSLAQEEKALEGSADGPVDLYDAGLLVLVIGEQPTGGVNQEQWDQATEWLAQHAPAVKAPPTQKTKPTKPADTDGVLRILGPSFSGSLVSLDRNLKNAYVAWPSVLKSKFPAVMMLSGSVTDCRSIRWFQNRWRGNATVFGTFQENDELHIDRFLRYLEQQGTNRGDTAIVSEDETAYGGVLSGEENESIEEDRCSALDTNETPPLRISYPRDISALRAAYQKQSIFSSPDPGGKSSSHVVLQSAIGQNESEEPEDSDTIHAFSGSLTAIAEEAELYGLVSTLRTHHIRYVVLRCTNPLDYLFLTRFFHRAYPDGRIVTVGTDLLYRREVDTTEFRGVLGLHSYPLLPRSQHWSALGPKDLRPAGHTHRVFQSGLTEGMYNAGRYVFGDAAKPKQGQDVVYLPMKRSMVPDYVEPYWLNEPSTCFGETTAPSWLNVVGRDGYWPVAVLNDKTLSRQNSVDPPSTSVRLQGDRAVYDQDPDGKHFRGSLLFKLPLPWKVCCCGAILLLVYQFYGVWRGHLHASDGLRVIFRNILSPSQQFLLGINSALASAITLAMLSIGLTVPRLSLFATVNAEYWILAATGCLLISLIGACLGGNYGRFAFLSFAASFASISGFGLWIIGRGINEADNAALFYRMAHLTAGVSPLLPVLVLLSGLYLWSWQGLAGNVLLTRGCPLLPQVENAPNGRPAQFGLLRHPFFKRLGERLPAGSSLSDRASDLLDLLFGQELAGTLREEQPTILCPNKMERVRYRISRELGDRIMNLAQPLTLAKSVLVLPIFIGCAFFLLTYKTVPLLSLEGEEFSIGIDMVLLLAFLLTVGEAARLYVSWLEFQRLLIALSRLRLRRTFAKLRAMKASNLWSVSGNVNRVQVSLLMQQLDSARRLSLTPKGNLLSIQTVVAVGQIFALSNEESLQVGSLWEQPLPVAGRPALPIRVILADAVGDVITDVLENAWQSEEDSLNLESGGVPTKGEREDAGMIEVGKSGDFELSSSPKVRAAEEFVCLHYTAFIQNMLARIRTMTLSMVSLFVSVCAAISFYPFVPRTSIGVWLMINMSLVGAVVIYVYAQMERNDTLSYIANTRPGRLGADFWLKTVGFLVVPILGILTTQFPAISDSILGWLQPGLDAVNK